MLLDIRNIILVTFSAAVILVPYVDVVAGLSVYNIMLIFFMFIYLLNNLARGDITFDKNTFTILLLLSFAYFLVCINPNIQREILSYRNIKAFLFPMVILLSASFILRRVEDYKLFLFGILISLSFSSLIAIMQFINIDDAWNLRLFIDIPNDKVVYSQINERIKPSGLAYFSVQLSYQLITFFPFLFYLYRIEKKTINKKIIFAIGALIASGAIAINSVTAMLLIILSVMVIYKWPSIRGVARLIIVFKYLIPIVIILTAFGFMDRVWNLDSSALSRLPMFISGITILAENPYGASYSEITAVKERLATQEWFTSMTGSSQVLVTGLHNSFLMVAVQNGIYMLIIYLFIYGYTIKMVLRQSMNRNISVDSRVFYRVSLASLCAYIFQSSFHNAGLPTGDVFGWLLLGIIYAYKGAVQRSEIS